MLFTKITCTFLMILLLCSPVFTASSPMKTNPVDTTRLAIVLGGAVSLGAFEAGAIAELVQQLEYYNKNHPEHQYVIDILAGASAGSMTLAILATQLYNPGILPDDLGFHKKNVFYKAWVDSIDIKYLLPDNRSDLKSDPYLLSRDRVDLLGDLYLTGEFNSDKQLSIAPKTLNLAMTLSNFRGNIESVEFMNGTRKEITTYDEQRIFKVSQHGKHVEQLVDKKYVKSKWENIRNVAIASGAFPVAFPPKVIHDEYTNVNQTDKEVPYVDGGFFRNYPLQIAKALASKIERKSPVYDRTNLDNSERMFIFITPVEGESEFIPSGKNVPQENDEQYLKVQGIIGHILKMAYTTVRTLDYREYMEDEESIQQELLGLFSKIYAERHDTEQVKNMLKTIKIFSGEGVQTDDLELIKAFIRSQPDIVAKETIDWSENLRQKMVNRLDILQLDKFFKEWLKSKSDIKLTIAQEKPQESRNKMIDQASALSLINDLSPDKNIKAIREIFYDEEFTRKHLCNSQFSPADPVNKFLMWLFCEADQAYHQLYVDLFEIGNYQLPSRYVLLANDPPDNLAGRKFFYFGGFLNKSLRDYDYKLGRYYAQQALSSQLGLNQNYNRISEEEKNNWCDSLDVYPDKLVRLKDHLKNEEDQKWFRQQLDKRLVAYANHMGPRNIFGLWASPLLAYADHVLDTDLYYTPKRIFLSWHINSDRPRSFDLGFSFNLFNMCRNSYIQASGWSWICYFLVHEHYIVLNSGFTDFLNSAHLSTYYQQAGLRMNLYCPKSLLRFIRIQPEMGYYYGVGRLRRDLKLADARGWYFATILRLSSFDLKFQKFYQDMVFEHNAFWKINFGFTFPVLDYLFFGRL